MSRLLRIIIFIIIILLLIFFGFRCSQNIPKDSKATANFIENTTTTNNEAKTTTKIDKTDTETKSATDIVINVTTEEPSEKEHNTDETSANSTKEETGKLTDTHKTETNTDTNASTESKNKDDQAKEQTKNTDKNKINEETIIDTKTLKAGASIVLKGVSFASGSDKLIDSSMTILNDVAKTLKEKSTLHIEIAGYTDNKGNADTNTKLSQLRADQVKAHLVSQKIKAERLSTKGYGADSPIASNETEAGRKQNRRVEIHIKHPKK